MASQVTCSDIDLVDISRFERECTNLSEINQDELNEWINTWQPSDPEWLNQINAPLDPSIIAIIDAPNASSSELKTEPASTPTFTFDAAANCCTETVSPYGSPDIQPEFVETAKGNFTVGKFFLSSSEATTTNQPPRDLAPAFQGVPRRRSISKIPLSELFEVMGLAHDPESALQREEAIMSIIAAEGFELGQQTWIRDTDPISRQAFLDSVFEKTVGQFGYSRSLLEAIIRRGTYSRMQCKLRRQRRHRVRTNLRDY